MLIRTWEIIQLARYLIYEDEDLSLILRTTVCLVLLGDGVFLCSFGCPGTHYVDKASNSQRSSCLYLSSGGTKVTRHHT